ncbi:gp288 [Sphingomonas phage PAU]|uniref:metallo-phosphoesterase n=1 Tax=Sphingomonas phage PAU TaxID=1150991 RepID=UPI000257349F|nr:metallo-phosphoesterase [Sphingomonas phage PAU]AFF28286.1 gp288 [Sphingomonas phage PAU]
MLKILHLSDIQIEIRRNSQRYDEYASALEEVISYAKSNLDISKVVLSGDIFEFCAVTDTERVMFIRFIKTLESIETINEIVITSGNHDLKQRFNDINISGVSVIENSVMDSLHESFKESSKIKVLTKSGFYPSNTVGLNWGAWAHEHKFDGNIENYSPWEREVVIEPKNVIEIYHDNFAGAMNFNGLIQKGCEDAKSFDMFKAKTILAGHIHNPQQFKSDSNQTFTYASSLVMRDFGEGDYYLNGNRTVKGLQNHGFYVHTIDTNDYSTVSSEFIPVDCYTTRATFLIDKNFNWETINDLRLDYVSKYKNMLRIVVTGNESKYHEKSAEILQAISRNVPNLEVSIDIDSSNIFSETSEDLDLELDKLVTEEQILDIAIPFIKRRIRSTKRILEEDKDNAETTTIELFKTQLLKLRKTIERNHITFHNLTVSNFLSFEDNVNIDFSKLRSLVKISGTNGIGKTNIMKTLKWIVDDLIDGSQARNSVNQNALDVFNDKRLDTNLVESTFVFSRNGKKYTLKKSIERFFKSRSKDITVHNWKEHIKNLTISKELLIQSSNSEETLTDLDLIQNELREIFGSVHDMEALLFTNANSLERLVKSNPDVLADQIMHHLGLRYFQDMSNDYENVRTEKLKTLSKPSKSIEAMVLELEDFKETKTNGSNIVKSLTEQKEIDSLKIATKHSEINELRETLHQVENPEMLETNIESTSKDIETKTNDLELVHTGMKTLSDALALDYKNFDAIIDEYNSEIKTIENEISELNNSVKLEASNLETEKQKVLTITESVKSEMNSEINNRYSSKTETLNSELKSKENEKNTVLTLLREAKHEFELKRNQKKSEFETSLSDAKKKAETLVELIDTNTGLITVYETATTCKTCGNAITGKALEEIQNRKNECQVKINESRNDLNEVYEAIKIIESELAKPYYSIEPNAWLTENCADNLKLARSLTDTITDIEKQIKEINDEKQKEIDSIIEKVKESKKVIDAIESYKIRKTSYDGFNQTTIDTISRKSDQVEEINGKISIVKKQKLDYDTKSKSLVDLKLKVPELTNIIENLKSKLERFKSDLEKMYQNKEVQEKIKLQELYLSQMESNLNETVENLQMYIRKVENATNSINDLETDIQDSINYRVMESSLAIYKTFIGKSGLNKLIFDAVSKKLNLHMNDLLKDSPYKLAFVNGVLHLIDSTNIETPVTRTAPAFSGMQIILGGLSLFYVLRNASLGTKYDCVFIDEISGPLNDGKELTYKAINYKQLLIDMIAKMRESSKVFIVDHYLDFYDGSILEVYPSNDGSNIKEILVPQA